jgi:hypothetical protein
MIRSSPTPPARPAQAQSGGAAIKFAKGESLLKDRGRNSDHERKAPGWSHGGFRPRAQLHWVSRRTADSQNGTIAVSDQGAAIKKSDPRQLELFSDGARAVAAAKQPKPPRPTEADLQDRLDAARQRLHEIVILRMKTWIREETRRGLRDAEDWRRGEVRLLLGAGACWCLWCSRLGTSKQMKSRAFDGEFLWKSWS